MVVMPIFWERYVCPSTWCAWIHAAQACAFELFTLERLVTGIAVHIQLHEVHGHVGSVIAVLELNIHGPPFLVNDRDLTEEATSRERETVIINGRLCREHVPCAIQWATRTRSLNRASIEP